MADQSNSGALVVLVPADSDPIAAASSEDFAHMTFVWFGDAAELQSRDTPEAPQIDMDELILEVRQYAAEASGPIVVPVKNRGLLGDEDADVVFLEPTDSLLAFRDGLMAEGQVGAAHAAVEQYPEWTPHVTLGYPETPAAGEYEGTEVTFDRIALWVGDTHHDFVLGAPFDGGGKPDQGALLAAARTAIANFDTAAVIADTEGPEVDTEGPEVDTIGAEVDTMPADELEDGEELVTEVPVHGVAAIEGRATGDGRGFRPGALSFGQLPQPLGYEFEHGHGAANSRVAIVGRIDEYWTVETAEAGVFEARWRGVIFPHKDWAPQAIESIIDGSYTGVSIVPDSVTIDVTDAREELRQRILSERVGAKDVNGGTEIPMAVADSEYDIEELLNLMVGDGTQEVTWFSSARVRRFDMVPTGAFIEGYTALGHEFADEMTPDEIEASAAALMDCGCADSQEQAEAIVAAARGEASVGSFIVVFDSRSDEGPLEVGPFETRESADDYVESLVGEDFEASWEVHELAEPRIVASAFAPGTKDGPGWITHPIPTSRIRRYWVRGEGAAKINWGVPGDFNRCRAQLAKYVQNPDWLAGLCANMHKEALGVWPGQEGGSAHALREAQYQTLLASGLSPTEANGTAWPEPAPLFSLIAAAAPVDAALFANPNLSGNVGIQIDGERIFGYVALWNVCHIGQPGGPGTCTMAPRSATNYSHYRTGTVVTTEGPVAVGSITMSTGHAGERLSPRAAAAHYDNTGAVVADVACGEDAYGIWFSGRLRPGVTDEQLYELQASGRLSGDWRRVGGSYEMVGALVVNVGGFPIPNASLVASAELGVTTAIIGEGIVPIEGDGLVAAAMPETPAGMTEADVAAIAIAAVDHFVFQQERARIVEITAPARAAINAYALAQARAQVAAAAQFVKETASA